MWRCWAPRCVQTREGFKFYNRDDVELLGDEDLDIVEDDLNEYLSVSEDEQDSIMESYSELISFETFRCSRWK